MKQGAVLSLVMFGTIGCRDVSGPRVGVRIVLTPSSIAFDAEQVPTTVVAKVFDHSGDEISDAIVHWGNGAGHVSLVATDSGRTIAIASLGNSTANIFATSGLASAKLQMTTKQVAVGIQKQSGDNQSGPAGKTLLSPVWVTVVDRGGAGVEGITVMFTADGGGSMSPSASQSGFFGTTDAVWTLGTTPVQHVTATVAGIGSVVFSATLTASSVGTPARGP